MLPVESPKLQQFVVSSDLNLVVLVPTYFRHEPANRLSATTLLCSPEQYGHQDAPIREMQLPACEGQDLEF